MRSNNIKVEDDTLLRRYDDYIRDYVSHTSRRENLNSQLVLKLFIGGDFVGLPYTSGLFWPDLLVGGFSWRLSERYCLKYKYFFSPCPQTVTQEHKFCVRIVPFCRLQSRKDQSPHFHGNEDLKSHEVLDHMCACVVHLTKLISDRGLAR
jgi:hypothetical protein